MEKTLFEVLRVVTENHEDVHTVLAKHEQCLRIVCQSITKTEHRIPTQRYGFRNGWIKIREVRAYKTFHTKLLSRLNIGSESTILSGGVRKRECVFIEFLSAV